MTNEIRQELKDILNNKGSNLYDFMANHYWELSKEEIKTLFLEVVDALYSEALYNYYDEEKANIKAHEKVLENLQCWTNLLDEE